MHDHPLTRAVRAANLLNVIQSTLGGLLLLYLLTLSNEKTFSEAAFSLFVRTLFVVTGWNSRRELRLIPYGGKASVLFYVTNSLTIGVGLLLVANGVSQGERLSSPILLLLAMILPSVNSLRVAMHNRDLPLTGDQNA